MPKEFKLPIIFVRNLFSMIIDIVITLFIIIGLIIGLFRNPIMSIIHLALFVAFSFLFYPLFIYVVPKILEVNNINIHDLASLAANGISMFNNELAEFGNSLNLNLITIPSIYSSPSYLEGALKGAVNSLSFFISSLLSFLLSYGVAWAIYALIKRYLLEYGKKKILKLPIKMSTSFVINAVFIFISLSFIFSPYQNVLYSYTSLVDTFNKVDLMGEVENEYQDVTNLIKKIKSTNNTLTTFEDRLTRMDLTIDEYFSFNFESEDKIVSLKEEINELNIKLNELILNEKNETTLSIYEGYKDELASLDTSFNEIVSLVGENNRVLYSFNADFDENLALIKEEKEDFSSSLELFESSVDLLNSVDNNLNKYLEILNAYKNKFPKSEWYGWLFNANYGYLNYLYNGTLYNLKGEINSFIEIFEDTLSKDLTLLKSYYNEEVVNGNNKIYEMEGRVDEINEKITYKENEFNIFKEDSILINEKIDENFKKIEETISNIKAIIV